MKPLRLALLMVAFICFVLHIYFDGWRPVTPGSSVSRPSFLGMGLAFWVFSEITTAFG